LAQAAFHLPVQISFGRLEAKIAIYKEAALCSFLPPEEVPEAVVQALL
jgi:hypothetical protein